MVQRTRTASQYRVVYWERVYSPFDKSIRDLKVSDLATLKTVHEGWYVEYKEELVKAPALAKAVSAFANTYGGWLFLGVKEKSRDNSVAGKFPGIPEAEVDGALQRLRQSAAMHLNPSPFFETKVMRGPCVEIGLAEGNSVIAIEIPQSHTAPHVHKDGRIYRRVADGSEPKPETDRFTLDQLWRRADSIREMTREWIKRDPEFSDEEDKLPYVRLLLCVDPWGQRDPWLHAPFSEIRNVLKSTDASSFSSIAFDTVHTTTEGVIARQVKGNNPRNYGLTWMMQRDMSCDIVLPVPFYTHNAPLPLTLNLDGYKYLSSFIEILKEQGHTEPRIADLNLMVHLLISVVSKYQRLLTLTDAHSDFYFKARVLNAWRILPFIDVESILDEFKTHGMPMIMNSMVTIPTGATPDSFALISIPPARGSESDEKVDTIVQAMVMFAQIATAFGISTLADRGFEDTTDLYSAGMRALTVQRNRNSGRFPR